MAGDSQRRLVFGRQRALRRARPSGCREVAPRHPLTVRCCAAALLRSRESALDVVDVLDDAVRVRLELDELERALLAAVEEALRLYPAERVFLNTDCGFGTFSNRPMNTLEIASAKVAAMAAAARDLRG